MHKTRDGSLFSIYFKLGHGLAIFLLAISTSALSLPSSTHVDKIMNSVFGRAAEVYGIDPILLYSVALTESAKYRGGGIVGPWALTLRTFDTPYYFKNKEAAAKQLQDFIDQKINVDVGLMQINLKWNGHRVSEPVKLFDPDVNVHVGAEILSEALASSPNDLELGVGRYFQWKNESLARNYGKRVLRIYKKIKDLKN